jgi:hypothetical protein
VFVSWSCLVSSCRISGSVERFPWLDRALYIPPNESITKKSYFYPFEGVRVECFGKSCTEHLDVSIPPASFQ